MLARRTRAVYDDADGSATSSGMNDVCNDVILGDD